MGSRSLTKAFVLSFTQIPVCLGHERFRGIVRGQIRGRRRFLLMTTLCSLVMFLVYFGRPNTLFSSFQIKDPSSNASRLGGRLFLNVDLNMRKGFTCDPHGESNFLGFVSMRHS